MGMDLSTVRIQDYGFGLGGVTNESSGETPGFGRVIEIRANIDF